MASVPVRREASSDGLDGKREARLVDAWRLQKQVYDRMLASLAARSTGKIWITEKLSLQQFVESSLK